MSAPREEDVPAPNTPFTTLLRLAWRNLWRQRRRTLLLVAVVAYATLATLFFWGLNEGLNTSILNGQARYLVAPVMVMRPAFEKDPAPENALQSLDFVPDLAQVPGVLAAAPRLEFPALLRSAYLSVGARVRGVDPTAEALVSAVPSKIKSGRMLAAPGEVVLGAGLAERLDLRLGERLVLDAAALAGPQALGLRLVGLVDAGVSAVDDRLVLIHLDDARLLTGVGAATSVALEVRPGQETGVAARLETHLPTGVRAYDLLSLLGVVALRVRVSRLLMVPVGLLFALFAALAVTSTVWVSVMERRKEFATVAALGLSPRRLAEMVVLEALLTTLLGWLLGLIAGYALLWLFHTQNLLGPFLASAAQSLGDFGIGAEIYTTVSPRYALYATATVAVAALMALLIPARRVAHLEPAAAMRD